MEDKDYCFILSHKWFLDRKDLFNRSLTNYGSKTHIYIEDETEKIILLDLKMMTTL